jgi:hypothetical protein
MHHPFIICGGSSPEVASPEMTSPEVTRNDVTGSDESEMKGREPHCD